ncbi:MAG TPA: M48 family metalloprotease [Candidatus Saccharimonadales bacterium]|nr:M48 family metalloprotease [Candidatus Saccharimonadales bacterium]
MYSDIAQNKRKTLFIMFVFMVFIGAIIWLFDVLYGGKSTGIFYGGLIGSAIYVIISYYSGAKMALAVNGAKEIQKNDNPRLFRIVENLAITDGLPTPRIFIMGDPAPNAFATGRDPKHAAVCVTSGLLDIMDDQELQGVIAHELGHVKNFDTRVMLVAFALTAVISFVADVILRMTWFSDNRDRENNQLTLVLGIVAAILAPFVASLIQLAVSRQREYLADATGALTTRYPEGLISALKKIEQSGSVAAHQNTATAHLFFANPLKGHSITNLFSTHPPIDQRIKRLEDMGAHA